VDDDDIGAAQKKAAKIQAASAIVSLCGPCSEFEEGGMYPDVEIDGIFTPDEPTEPQQGQAEPPAGGAARNR
jgi:hypothetical protein